MNFRVNYFENVGLKWFLVVCLAFFQQYNLFAQTNYFQENRTDLSEEFLFSKELVEETISQRYGELTRGDGLEVRRVTENGSIFTRSLHSSGKVFFDCGANDYLNELKSKLLADYPKVNELIRVYTTKNSSLNAFATVNNNIYVNVGLLASVENEAQLAYILCHEIMHIVNQHIIAQTLKVKEKKETYDQGDVLMDSEIFALHKHSVSRDHETEADLDGITLFLKQAYNPFESVNALKILEASSNSLSELSFSGNSLFADSISFRRMNDYLGANQRDSVGEKKSVDPRYMTHPLISERIKKVKELLNDQDNEGVTFLLSESRFNEIKSQSTALLQSIYAEDFDFLNLFKASAMNYHQKNDRSEKNLNYLCYSLQGMYVQKQNHNFSNLRVTEFESRIDSSFVLFLTKTSKQEFTRWVYQALNQLNKSHLNDITNRYMLAMKKNTLLAHGSELSDICDDCGDMNPTDSTFFVPDSSLKLVQFYVNTSVNLTLGQLLVFNNQGTSQYSSGKVAITSSSNTRLHVSAAGDLKAHYPRKDEKLDRMTEKVWRNLEEDYPENVVSVVPNDQSYTKEQYANFVTLSNWMEARLYFDDFNYVYFDKANIDQLKNTEDISYTFSTINLEIKGVNGARALLLILGMIPAPIYVPQLTASLFLGNTRKFQLSVFFDLDNGKLAYWDTRTYLNPSSTAMFHQNYNDVITNFIKK